MLSHHTIPSPVGPLTLTASDRALVAVRFGGTPAGAPAPTPLLRRVAEELAEYFAGVRRSFTLPLDAEGTPFRQEVWRALRTIPYGRTCSYGQIAAAVGRPKASRAVGAANHDNPLAIVVPCHRVVGGNGKLTGYAGGLETKRRLLALEASVAAIPDSLAEYLAREILPRYRAFDRAHGVDHALTVMARSLALAERLGADPATALTVAAYHDTGLAFGRERHHLDAGRILAEDPALRRWFDEERIDTMREAAEDHRASAARAPRSLYGRIVAEADRQIDPATILRRTVQYGLAHTPDRDREGQWERCVGHLVNKYAEGGYLRLWIAESDNARRLEELRALIGDRARLRALFDAIYDEERAAGTAPSET